MLSTKRQIASSVALLLAMANNDRDRGVQFSFQRKRWRKQREHNERNTLETSMKQLGLDLNVAKETHTCAENIYTYPFRRDRRQIFGNLPGIQPCTRGYDRECVS